MMAQDLHLTQVLTFLVMIGQTRFSMGLPFSNSATEREGARSERRHAAIRPPMPPPMMAMSYCFFT